MMLWQTRYMTRIRDFILGAAFIVGVIVSAVYSARSTDAATASVTYSFSAGQKIVASQVNTNFNDLISTLNGNLNTDNFLDGGIATADLGSSVVTTAKINDSAVTTAKINDAAVTAAKLASANIVTADAAPFGTGQIDGIVASASITTSAGRPIRISFGNVNNPLTSSWFGNNSGSGEIQTSFRINGSTQSTVVAAFNSTAFVLPCSSFFNEIHTPGVGTHRFDFIVAFSAGQKSNFTNCKIQLQEL